MKLNNDKWIAYTSELANRILEMKFGKEYKSKCLVKVGTCTHYTELGQTTFDNIYDDVDGQVGLRPPCRGTQGWPQGSTNPKILNFSADFGSDLGTSGIIFDHFDTMFEDFQTNETSTF